MARILILVILLVAVMGNLNEDAVASVVSDAASKFDAAQKLEKAGEFKLALPLYLEALKIRRNDNASTFAEGTDSLEAVVRVKQKLNIRVDKELEELKFREKHPSVGEARMDSNNVIVLNLFGPGGGGSVQQTILPSSDFYPKLLRHLDGLKPGETKLVPGWLDFGKSVSK